MNEAVLQAEELERQQLAVRLHKGLCQWATVLSASAYLLREAQSIEEVHQLAEEMQGQVRSFSAEIQSLVRDLRGTRFQESGLRSAIEQLRDRWAGQHACELRFVGNWDDERFSDAARRAVYWLVRQMVEELIWEGKIQRGEISIHYRDQQIAISIEFPAQDRLDNPADNCNLKVGYLSTSLLQRVHSWNGHFQVESSKNQLTQICICFPPHGMGHEPDSDLSR